MTEEQCSEHDRAFTEACSIVKDEIPMHDRRHLPVLGWLLRRQLTRALALFDRVLQLNPENWSAMWFAGKVHERFEDRATALSWFERAYQVNPSQLEVAREASMCAMELGHTDTAISFAHRAIQIQTDEPGLHANLALAFIIAGRIPDAQAAINRALDGDPTDTISQIIRAISRHFAENGRTPPTSTPALRKYWAMHRDSAQ